MSSHLKCWAVLSISFVIGHIFFSTSPQTLLAGCYFSGGALFAHWFVWGRA